MQKLTKNWGLNLAGLYNALMSYAVHLIQYRHQKRRERMMKGVYIMNE